MSTIRPTAAQRRYLARGLEQPGGKLPLFDEFGQQISPSTVQACVRHGWAEPWFANPIKPDWLVCKLTAGGHAVLGRAAKSAKPSRSDATTPIILAGTA